MLSKHVLSAPLSCSYHNLIILMILLLNPRHCTCIHPEGGKPRLSALYESHMKLGKCPRVTIDGRVCVSALVCVCESALMRACKCVCANRHNLETPMPYTPPDGEREACAEEVFASTSPVRYQSNTTARGGLIVPFYHRLLNYLD